VGCEQPSKRVNPSFATPGVRGRWVSFSDLVEVERGLRTPSPWTQRVQRPRSTKLNQYPIAGAPFRARAARRLAAMEQPGDARGHPPTEQPVGRDELVDGDDYPEGDQV